jgi:RNase adaptor protein for sRNA GlmZ degradation
MAKARLTDPVTSQEAAESVKNVTPTQILILSLLEIPQTDEELVTNYNNLRKTHPDIVPRASASGIRSRRAELFQMEKVVPVGYAMTESNRRAIVWERA